MQLITANVGPFRSISTPQKVTIDPAVTVLVGMNEAGKTVFMQALHKSADVLDEAKYDHIDDYPRHSVNVYSKTHEQKPAVATVLTYQLSDVEVAQCNAKFGTVIKKDFSFSVNYHYNNTRTITLSIPEQDVIKKLSTTPGISSDAKQQISKAESFRQIPERLSEISLTDQDEIVLKTLNERIAKTKWPSVIASEVWNWIEGRVPKFLYFSDYDVLPGKMNLEDLASRKAKVGSQLQVKHKAVLALLRMADVSVDEFTSASGYESQKAKIEGVNIRLTDQIMEFWKQNEDIDIEVDIKSDSSDEAPFNNGPNLYLRIRNRRHRGVSTSFDRKRHAGHLW